jgi:HEPN superfamily RiboL-PSP-like protein
VDFLVFNQADRYQKSKSFDIQTESNLSSSVVDNICFNVGITLGDEFDLSRQFIDRNLVKTRNSIAHGSPDPVDAAFLIESRDRVVKLLNVFRNELQNAIVRKLYLR